MRRKPYFQAEESTPAPLSHTVERRVRFEEVDPLAIVWHGRYPSYFEDARVALGEHFGIGYMDFYREGVLAPIKKMHVDYLLPLQFGDRFTIEARLHYTEAARLNHEFILRNEAGEVVTTGYTVQMLLNTDQTILLVLPEFYLDFQKCWCDGGLA